MPGRFHPEWVADLTRISQVYPVQVLLPARATGLRHDSKAQAEQVRSVAVQQLGPRIRSVPPGSWWSWTRRFAAIWRCSLLLLPSHPPRLIGDGGRGVGAAPKWPAPGKAARSPSPRVESAPDLAAPRESVVHHGSVRALPGLRVLPRCGAVMALRVVHDPPLPATSRPLKGPAIASSAATCIWSAAESRSWSDMYT